VKKAIPFFIAVSALLFSLPLLAAFPSAYYPARAHPRLWLTAERLEAFQNSRQQDGEPWRDFKALCDSLVDADPANDPWNLDHAAPGYGGPLALMYRLTGDHCYADRAMELMEQTAVDFSAYGDPDHENFYFLGLAYDWLYDYPGMTPAKKAACRDKMTAVSTKFWQEDNLNASGTDSDQNLLIGVTHLVMGVAMCGDCPDAVTLLDRGWKGWDEGYFLNAGVGVHEPFTINLSLAAGADGADADWWLLHVDPRGRVSHYDLNSLAFLPGSLPTLQGEPLSFPPVSLPALTFDDPGSHWFCFAIDLEPDGVLDSGPLFYDCVQVQIENR
jgi:hypothetical protein